MTMQPDLFDSTDPKTGKKPTAAPAKAPTQRARKDAPAAKAQPARKPADSKSASRKTAKAPAKQSGTQSAPRLRHAAKAMPHEADAPADTQPSDLFAAVQSGAFDASMNKADADAATNSAAPRAAPTKRVLSPQTDEPKLHKVPRAGVAAR